MERLRLAVIGIGAMGMKHLELVRRNPTCALVGLSDQDVQRKALADELGVAFYQSPEELIEKEQPAGVIIATPNAHHGSVAALCAERSVHMLIEKPIADTLPQALRIVAMAKQFGVHVLVGHHRRHSPLIRETRNLVRNGALGQLLGVSVLWTIMKPDNYFTVSWRRERNVGGPLLINLIHDLDSLRFICGEISEVYARTSSAARGLAVEDSLTIALTFANGALGSILASDATPGAWSYEATVGENPLYFRTHENCYHFLGTGASLAFPRMELWRYADAQSKGWQHPLEQSSIAMSPADPLELQLEHFCRVVRGEEEPLTTAEDGTRSLAVALAVQQSAAKGVAVAPASLL